MIRSLKRKNQLLKIILVLATIVFIGGFAVFGTGRGGEKTEKAGQVRLLVMVVIDQLRADMISRLEDRLTGGGFAYLINNGTWYKNARFRYATTLTAVGHAAIFTGAVPASNGIVGNFWYDREIDRVVKSTAQSIKPATANDRKIPPNRPCGPYQLTSSTIGDELVMASNHRSRVFSVSFKDRGSILPGGFLGKAFWFEKGDFQTDEYYYKPGDYPKWLPEWHQRKNADRYLGRSWELLHEKSSYIFGNPGPRPEASRGQQADPISTAGSGFPHSLPFSAGSDYFKKLSETPFLDDLTVEFACHVLREERLGQGEFTDMLAVSLSATDVIGHRYGPDSLEYEDNALRVDRSLAELFSGIEKTVGLANSVIVVTADHGVASIPEHLEALGMPGGKLNPQGFENGINRAIQKKFATPPGMNFVIGFWNPSVFLDEHAIANCNLPIAEVENVAADALRQGNQGIAFAVTRTDLLKGNVPDTPLLASLRMVFHPRRSGNILIVQQPFQYLYHEIKDAAMHGSPYNYDTHVPLFFTGPGIPKRMVYRLVYPEDIAVTLALKLGIQAPPAASANALSEVLGECGADEGGGDGR